MRKATLSFNLENEDEEHAFMDAVTGRKSRLALIGIHALFTALDAQPKKPKYDELRDIILEIMQGNDK